MKPQNSICYLMLSAFILMTAPVNAELNVVADLGGESAIRFYEPIQPVHSENAPKHPNAIPSSIPEENMLPVVSHKWSIGQVKPKALNLPGALPIFLIGDDETSQHWLAQRKTQLQALGATGLVINVQTMEGLNRLRHIAPELTIVPVSADALAERLGISNYPLLMTAEGVSQ